MYDTSRLLVALAGFGQVARHGLTIAQHISYPLLVDVLL